MARIALIDACRRNGLRGDVTILCILGSNLVKAFRSGTPIEYAVQLVHFEPAELYRVFNKVRIKIHVD